MEGKFASEGLQAIDGDDDMLTAMARELVENKGIGESAESVWRQLRPARSLSSPGENAEAAVATVEIQLPETVPSMLEQMPGAALRQAVGWARRSSRKSPGSGQLSLF
jgi:hypothetical protein